MRFCGTKSGVLTSLSAVYRACASLAKLSLMVWSWSPRPSAASLLSSGIVKPYKRGTGRGRLDKLFVDKITLLHNMVNKNQNTVC